MAKSASLSEISHFKLFGGIQKVYSHNSTELGCPMKFGVYLPPQYGPDQKLPVIYFLSGLECSQANFIEKSGAQKLAATHGIILVNPDTSPRGLNIPGDSDSWDFGVGASFYLNAAQDPWKQNYRMFDYVTVELIAIVKEYFNVAEAQSIMGHSMGGHGALVCSLKNPGLFRSVSAFAAIANPMECPWGQKAFAGYLGPKQTSSWHEWDATELAKVYNGPPLNILLDQGDEDKFLKAGQLNPTNFIAEAKGNPNLQTTLVMRDGYDHSYYHIKTFIDEHINFHLKHLK